MSPLSAEELTFRIPGSSGPPLLDGVSLTVARGELVDVMGASGSGKSTLLRALARLLPGCEGALFLDGTPAERIAPTLWRSRVSLVSQKTVIRSGSVSDNLLHAWKLKVRAAQAPPSDSELRLALDSVGLHEVALQQEAARLSVGQAARIALLRSSLTCPDVLLLDEPDANLDAESAELVSQVIARFLTEGGAVLRVCHFGSHLTPARRLRLQQGALTEVTP
ncbi:MAG: ATP-binding cassette domain-containing protein [Actinobacteria bacterium]|nr:ATP-binding cassette domain-containing protein [Actinomycetota bacterium]